MKIYGPLRSKDQVIPLSDAGVSNFYFGVMDARWLSRFGVEMEMNRRSFCGAKANFTSINDLAEAIKIGKDRNKIFHLVLNNHQFSRTQAKYAHETIQRFAEIGGDGVVVADISLIPWVKECGMDAVISTDLPVYNSETVRFLVDRYSINRLVIPRDMTLDEIQSIKNRFPDVELEVFIINGPCRFADSVCLPIHSTEHGAFCRFLDQCKYTYISSDGTSLSQEVQLKLQENLVVYKNFFFNMACGLCGIFRLQEIGVEYLKVVGRTLPLDRLVHDITLVNQHIKLAEGAATVQEYVSAVQAKMLDGNVIECQNGYNCYFPEVGNYAC